jgi:hypothetical protein
MPRHVVVDGSNLATEGRPAPSLKQLNEVVAAWRAKHPHDLITVVVDATFGHRIDPKEVKAFDHAIDHNEIVAPPAGAVGRGDAFVLAIADQVDATVLSNDSYQEFHGQYEWLFDEGRLFGGKPVPHVGWVFVPRSPVRGPTSRKAVRDAKRADGRGEQGKGDKKSGKHDKKASKEASQPMPVPTSPPPGLARKEAKGQDKGAKAQAKQAHAPAAETATKPTGHHINDLVAFLSFVESHPVGTTLTAVVESYSSHGAYVRIGDVTGYVPLRLMSDPPPRSARDLFTVGDAVTLVVAAFNPGRRGVDLGLPGMVPTIVPGTGKTRKGKKKVAEAAPAAVPAAPEAAVPAVDGPVAADTAPAPAVRRRRRGDVTATADDVPALGATTSARTDAAAIDATPAESGTPGASDTPAKKRTRAKAASRADVYPGEVAPVDAATTSDPPQQPAKEAKPPRKAKAASAAKRSKPAPALAGTALDTADTTSTTGTTSRTRKAGRAKTTGTGAGAPQEPAAAAPKPRRGARAAAVAE